MNEDDILNAAEHMANPPPVSGFYFDHAHISAFARWAADQEKSRIICLLEEMQREVGDRHNYYGVAAMRIKEMK